MPAMTRAEPLSWAKERALEYVGSGNISEAVVSFISDLNKHPELNRHPALEMFAMGWAEEVFNTSGRVRHEIEGFN